MKNKTILALVFSLVLLVAATTVSALADKIMIQQVKIDGTEVEPNSLTRLDLERGQSFDVKILLNASEDLENVQVYAFITGYEHSSSEPITDGTSTFDMEANVTYTKRLTLKLPSRLDEDDYRLRVVVADRNGDELVQNYKLKADVPRHDVTIRDVVFSPEGSVQAGRALLATVRVKNTGEKTEDGLKVRVSIPDLGIGATDFIDEIDADDSTTSEELFLRIPQCAVAGDYAVKVTVEFNEGEDVVSATEEISVVESDVCPIKAELEGKVTITVSGETQQLVVGGAGAVYPVTLANSGGSGKTFVLNVDGVAPWGTARVSPSNVVTVAGGETKSAFVFVSANAGVSSGQKLFAVKVEDAAGNKLQDIALKADVQAGSSSAGSGTDLGSARRALEIGLVVLVVLIVLVGLVIALRRMRGPGEGEESQTYY